jgi:tetratricopeptide (TPR) repeat protein
MSNAPEESASTPEQRNVAAKCWRTGNEAVPKENWDYAIQMYATSVKLVPDNLMYRQSLRGTEYKKYGDNKTGAAMAGMKLMGPKGTIKKCRMSRDWKGIAEAAEAGLQINPWDPQLNADLGDACKELGYKDVAVFAYTCSLQADPANVEVNKALGLILEEKGEYDGAVKCWERVLKVDKNNGEARTKITALAARNVMDRGGYEGAESTKNVIINQKIAEQVGKTQADGPGMSVEADIQRAIRKDPNNKDLYLKLADYYKREGQLEQAEEQYQQALKIASGDVGINELLEDVQLAIMYKTHTDVKEQFRQKPDDAELKQRAIDLGNELLQREIETFAARVERYPQDMRLKYELACRYMKVKKWALAIPLFQQSRGDPRVKSESLVNLGKCFSYDKKPALAIRQFEAAMAEVKFEEKAELFKDLYYCAGRLYEETKNVPAAEEAYQKVLEVDYSYRDTVTRLDNLQAGETAT